MKNRLIILTALGLIIVGCNLPQVQSPTQPQPQQVASAVASTLTVLPTDITTTIPPSQTPKPMETQTETPSITPEPSQTMTPSLTPTATANPDDPKQSLGTPTFKDTLDSGNAFFKNKPWVVEDEYNRISVEGGKMTLTSFGKVAGYQTWRLGARKPKNFYLEAKFLTKTCSGADLFGIVFRAPDYSSGYGYYLGITCDGQYSLSKWDDNGNNTMVNLTPHSQILTGAGQTNYIGVMAINDSIKIYLNNKMIREVKNSTLLDLGYFGPTISGQSAGMTVELDEITYWELP